MLVQMVFARIQMRTCSFSHVFNRRKGFLMGLRGSGEMCSPKVDILYYEGLDWYKEVGHNTLIFNMHKTQQLPETYVVYFVFVLFVIRPQNLYSNY